jgi:hypothetical protein
MPEEIAAAAVSSLPALGLYDGHGADVVGTLESRVPEHIVPTAIGPKSVPRIRSVGEVTETLPMLCQA